MAKQPPSVIKMAQKRDRKTRDIRLVEFPVSRDFADHHSTALATIAKRDTGARVAPMLGSLASSAGSLFAGTPGKLVFDLCCRLQQDPGKFEALFPQIKKTCMTLAEAAPAFGPLILNLGYHLSRFDYGAAVERAYTLMHYEGAVLDARGPEALERVFDELTNLGRYN